MTYNIRSGNGDLTGTAAAIRAESPDVVGLQEVDVHWAQRSGFADEAAELGKRLHMNVRFARIYSIGRAAAAGGTSDSSPGAAPSREFGVALLSRFPITRFSNDSITRLSTQEADPEPTRMPGLLDATMEVHGVRIRVFDTHLDYRADPRIRAQQVAEMMAVIDTIAGPVLVVGDMNAAPDAAELQPLLHRLQDAWTAPARAGPSGAAAGNSYPADAPRARDDYVLVSREFRVVKAWVPSTAASDHRPVVVELTLEPHGAGK